MIIYDIEYSLEANADINELLDVIIYDYSYPMAAFKYVQGLKCAIEKLRVLPESYQIQTHKSLLRYGNSVRRVNYKRMAIIYTVHGNIVYIHRIIAASMITTL